MIGGSCSPEYTLVRFCASLFSSDVTVDIAFDVVDAPFLNSGFPIVGSSMGCNVGLQSACAALLLSVKCSCNFCIAMSLKVG